MGWLFWALVFAITVVGLPFARQCIKLAHFSLWPFGRTIVKDPTASKLGAVGAILWAIPGLVMEVGCVLSGALLGLSRLDCMHAAVRLLAASAVRPRRKGLRG